MIKLAVFDIDGTLFDEHRKVYYQSSVDALDVLQRKGIKVAVASGRPPAAVGALADAGINPDYFICSNGHYVAGKDEKPMVNEVFSSQLADEVYEYCRANGIGLLWKYPESVYVYINDKEFDAIFMKNKANDTIVDYNNKTIHMEKEANGGCLACNLVKLKDFNAHFKNRCAGININGFSSDLVLYGVSKKYGLAKLLEELHIGPKECIAFGDNLNDLEIIEFAGIGVCMGNGVDELKKRSDFVTTAVDEDGIMNGLRHYKLLD